MTQKRLSGWLLLLTMLVLLITSCSKSAGPQPIPQPVPAAGKLSKIQYDDGAYDSVYYNPDGSVQSFKSHYTIPSPFTEVYTFEYGNDQQLARITTNTSERYEYRYVSGVLISVQHFIGNQKVDYRIYDYTAGKLTSAEEYYQPSPNTPGHELVAERKYTYYADGNLQKEESYSFDRVTRIPVKDMTLLYSDYDNKANPADVFARLLYLYPVTMANNNARRMTTRDAAGMETQFTASYTYNNSGNPTQRQTSYQAGSQSYTSSVTYHYY